MLKDRKSFSILMCDESNNEKSIIDTVRKISLRRHIGFNRVKLTNNNECAYVLYDIDKQYLFDMARNKKLKIVWKDPDLFAIIDFGKNTKGDIVCHLSTNDTGLETFEGDIITPNLKKEFMGKKVMLVSSNLLDDTQPFTYEHFCFYKLKL